MTRRRIAALALAGVLAAGGGGVAYNKQKQAVKTASAIVTSVTPWSVALASGFSAFIGIIFGVAPAIRAARLDPIEALRYE